MILYRQLRMMEAINPWMYWIHLLLAVGLAKLWDQLGFIIWGESMAISGTNFIIIAIVEVKVQSAVFVHWSEGHEEMTEIENALTEIKEVKNNSWRHQLDLVMDLSST